MSPFYSHWLLISTVLNISYRVTSLTTFYITSTPYSQYQTCQACLGAVARSDPSVWNVSPFTDMHCTVCFLTSFRSFLKSQISFPDYPLQHTKLSCLPSLFDIFSCFAFLHIIYLPLYIVFIYLFGYCMFSPQNDRVL